MKLSKAVLFSLVLVSSFAARAEIFCGEDLKMNQQDSTALSGRLSHLEDRIHPKLNLPEKADIGDLIAAVDKHDPNPETINPEALSVAKEMVQQVQEALDSTGLTAKEMPAVGKFEAIAAKVKDGGALEIRDLKNGDLKVLNDLRLGLLKYEVDYCAKHGG